MGSPAPGRAAEAISVDGLQTMLEEMRRQLGAQAKELEAKKKLLASASLAA